MIALFCLCLALFVSPFKSKSRLVRGAPYHPMTQGKIER